VITNHDIARLVIDLFVGGFVLIFSLLLLLAFATWIESQR
jgi:hypothetical protein